QNVANTRTPFGDALEWEGLVAVGFHELEKVLSANELHHQVCGLTLFNEFIESRHDGGFLQSAKDLGLTPEEAKADGKFLRIGAEVRRILRIGKGFVAVQQITTFHAGNGAGSKRRLATRTRLRFQRLRLNAFCRLRFRANAYREHLLASGTTRLFADRIVRRL